MAANNGDWIKLHRTMMDNPIFQHDGLFRLWCYCLLRANWKPRKWLIPGTMQEIEVARGSFITGRQSLFASMYPQTDNDGNLIQREYAPAPITLWRWLKSLEKMGCVTMETVNNRCSLITIVNYSTYQDQNTSDDQVVNRSRSGGEQVVNTIEESKKERRKEKSVFTPPTVDQVSEYCRERSNSVDPSRFVNYYESKGWKVGKNTMKDWKAAVRTWESPTGQEPVSVGTDRRPKVPAVGSEELLNWKP